VADPPQRKAIVEAINRANSESCFCRRRDAASGACVPDEIELKPMTPTTR